MAKGDNVTLPNSSRMDNFSMKPSDEFIQFIKDNKIKVSVVASSIRGYLWDKIYEDLSFTNVDFEIIFCGDCIWNNPLPPKFRYIYTKVKPAQCTEIAARNATGDFVWLITDDLFINKYCMDNLVKTFYEAKDDMAVCSCRFFWNKSVIYHNNVSRSMFYKYLGPDTIKENGIDESKVPEIGCTIFMKRDSYLKIGGIDRNFVALVWEWDIAMRSQAAGGKIHYSDYSLISEKLSLKRYNVALSKHPLWDRKEDKNTMSSFWIVNKVGKRFNEEDFYPFCVRTEDPERFNFISRKRLKEVEPFSNNGILVESQGRKGIW